MYATVNNETHTYSVISKETPMYAVVNKETPDYAIVNKDIEESYQDTRTEQPNQTPNQDKIVPLYSYADVTINSSKPSAGQVTSDGETEESGWAENLIYCGSEENEPQLQEGWNDNNLYATNNE